MKRSFTLKSIIVACLLLIQFHVSGQVNIFIRILPPYPTKFTDYASRPQLMVISVTNTTDGPLKIQLRGSISGDNGISIRSKPGYRSSKAIELGKHETANLNGNDISYFFDYTKLEYSNITQNEFINKGGLPEGQYQLCLRAFDYDTNDPISPDEPLGCSNFFTISSLEPPVILSPMADQVIPSGPGQVFIMNWNTPVSTPPTVKYRIRMVEVLGNKNPNDAFMTATTPYFFEKEVPTNMYVYQPSDPQLTPGRKYALMIEAFDPFNNVVFRNNGRSEVVSFEYQDKTPVTTAQNTDPVSTAMGAAPNCSCKEPIVGGSADNSRVKPNSSVLVGKFTMKVTEVSLVNGTLNGRGTIALPFLSSMPGASVRVKFSDLNVNTEGKMINGQVEAIVSTAGLSLLPQNDPPEVPTMSLTPDQVKNLGSFFESNVDHLASAVKNSANSTGFELPLGFDAGPVTVGVMRMYFTAQQAWFDAAAAIEIPDGSTRVAVSGKGICMTPDDLCGEAQLYLTEDFKIPVLNITLKKQDDTADKGTYVLFDKTGFKSLHIKAEYTFPGDKLVNTEGGGPVTATFEADTEEGWSDWIAYASIQPFSINGLADFKFSMKDGNLLQQQKIAYDHSTLKNAENMPPKIESGTGEYIDTSSPMWQGLYIPLLNVELPSIITKAAGNNPVIISATNFIFQEGLTGRIQTQNTILELKDGSLDGWFFSVDDIGLNFFKNSLTSGSMKGKLMLPASGDQTGDNRNQLNYTSTLSVPKGQGLAFQFVVAPKNDLQFSALWAHVTIDSTSNILIQANSTVGFKAEATLNGKMTLDAEISGLPNLSLGYMTFQNMKFSTQGTLFSPGQFEVGIGAPPSTGAIFNDEQMYGMLSSGHGPNPGNSGEAPAPDAGNGQQKLMGFNFSIDQIQPYFQDNKAGISILSRMELVNGVNFIPKAELGFSFYAKTDAATDGRKWWKSMGGEINKVKLEANANLAGMKLEGFIEYFNTPANSSGSIDRGFAGGLKVIMPGFATQFAMKAMFGSRITGANSFQFFYVDALLDLGNSGIPMFPGTTLYGFAGGAYYNMERDMSPTYSTAGKSMPDINSDAAAYVNMESFSGVKYVPKNDNGSTFGILAGVYFGLQSRNVFDAELSLNIQFSNGSLNLISLKGRGNVLNNGEPTFNERFEKAMARAEVNIDVMFKEGDFWKFDLGLSLDLKYPTSSPIFLASGWTQFYIENMNAGSGTVPDGGQNVRWFLKAGRPWNKGEPLSATFDAKIFKINATAYFQCGNWDVDDIPPVPPLIDNILNGAKSEKNGGEMEGQAAKKLDINPDSHRENGSDSGMIMGAMVGFDAHPKFAIFYADLEAALGADFSLKFYDTNAGEKPCKDSNASWYARGQAFIGAQAACGVRVNVFGFKGDIEFLKAGVAAVVSAGAPEPLYAYGELGGSFSVLDGLVDGRFHIKFKVGNMCTDEPNSDQLQLIATLNPAPESTDLQNTLVRPAVSFNFPITTDFIVPIVDLNTRETSYTLFRFSKEDVTINLNGGAQSFNSSHFVYPWGNDKLIGGRQMNSKVYSLNMGTGENMTALLPNTKYTYEVKAGVKKLTIGSLFMTKESLESMKNKDYYTPLFQPVKNDDGSIYQDSKTANFTTDKGPERISIANVEELLPYHRQQNLPVNALNGLEGTDGYGYIKLVIPMTAVNFNLKVSNPQAYIRIVNVSQGNANLQDIPVEIVEGGKLWRFRLPVLAPFANYALKVFFRGDQTTETDVTKTTILKARANYTSLFKVSDRALVVNALAMKPNEQELLAWYFKTGAATDYKSKFSSMQLTKLIVGGMEASINKSKTVNLTNFEWEADSTTKTMRALSATFEFKATEPFNTLDVDDNERNKILPISNLVKADRKWKNMMERSNINPWAGNIEVTQSMYDQFSLVAFGPNKKLNFKLLSLPWNAVTGGVSTRSDTEYPTKTGLLPENMFDINFSKNNYGVPDETSATGLSGDAPAPSSGSGNSPAGNIVKGISSGTLKGTIVNGMASNVPNFINAKPDYTTTWSSYYQNGKGQMEASNKIFKDIVQEKKNLGYPGDAFNSLEGYGTTMDGIKSQISGSAGTVMGPAGLSVPQIKVTGPKLNIR